MRTLKYLLLLLFAPLCFSQGTPNCTLNFTFNASNLTSSNFANSTLGCDKWTLLVYNAGFGSFTVTLQSALAATPSSPGTFGTYTGTTATGSNPMTTTGISTFTNGTVATPWMRVVFTGTGSGTVYGVLQGSQTVISKGGGGGGGGNLTIAGTANEIAVAGAGCTPANSGTCTISIPSNANLPGAPTTTTATTGDNTTKIATTAYVNSEITNSFAGCTFITGSLTCPGSITSGSGSGVAGILDMAQGTAPSIPANAWGWVAPTVLTTSWYGQPPNASPTANQMMSFPAPTGNISQWTWITPGGTCTSGQFVNAISSTIAPTCATPSGGGGGAAGATLFSTTNSTTVTATSPTTLIGTVTGSTTVPANTFTAGQVLEFAAQGFYSTPATPASLTISLNIGGTIRITTGAVVQIASITNGVWRVRCMVTTRTSGSSGTQIANCIFEGTGATLTPGEAPMQTSSTWTIDTTATQALDLVATWSTTTGAPTITSTNIAGWIPGAPVTSVAGLTGAVPGQGTDANVLTAGVFTGATGTGVCKDANGGATTVGCSGGGGPIVHHQYYVGAASNGAGGTLGNINAPSGGSFLSNFPVGLINGFADGGAVNWAVFLPSTWTGSITASVDVITTSNGTGTIIFTPRFQCFANAGDLGATPSYTTGSNVTINAPGGSGTGFYRESAALTYAMTGCTAGSTAILSLLRATDTYGSNTAILGIDVAITY